MKKILVFLTVFVFALVPVRQAEGQSQAVATIAPLHSLVSGVAEGIDKVGLIVPAETSPHGFILRPSHIREMSGAKAVFYIGGEFEHFLHGALDSLPPEVRKFPVGEKAGIKLLKVRSGPDWQGHSHGDSHEDEHEDSHEHSHEDSHEHSHGDSHEDEHEDSHEHSHEDSHEDEHGENRGAISKVVEAVSGLWKTPKSTVGADTWPVVEAVSGLWKTPEEPDDHHSHGYYDMHVWLSPKNAEKIVKAAAEELSQISPEHGSAYRKNAMRMTKKLKKLDAEIRKLLSGSEKIPYIVFHDAYIYFERNYGLNPVGSVTVNPEIPLSAGRLKKIRAKILKTGAACVFSEPQFGKIAVNSIVKGTNAKSGSIDPLGAGLEPGPGLYFELMENLAREVKRCLN